jgi:hypothetical protein
VRLESFAPRETDDPIALLVLRFAAPVDEEVARALRADLVAAGVVGVPVEPEGADGDRPTGPRQVMGLRWLPPSDVDAAEHRRTLEQTGDRFGVETAWCLQVGTSRDAARSQWRNGPPPQVQAVPFPVEGYPEIIEEYDWYDFGIALKFAGPPVPGEEALLQEFLEFWLQPYLDDEALAAAAARYTEDADDAEDDGDDEDDEDADDLEDLVPYRNTGLEYHARRHTATLWVDRFQPDDPDILVHHLLWIAARIHDVLPVIHARFRGVEMAVKFRGLTGDMTDHVVLAGNPLRDVYQRDGEAAAMAWSRQPTEWAPEEVAAMLAELVTDHAPDEPDQAAVAIRLAERAIELYPAEADAPAYLVQLLIQNDRLPEALARVRNSGDPDLALHAVSIAVEHAPDRLGEALAAVPATPEALDALYQLAYKQGHTAAGLAVYRRILEMPMPAEGDERTNYLQCLNNACIIAHAIGDYPTAVEIADLAQPVAAENPYIYHSAACAYAAVADYDRAFAQVELAVRAGYEHLDKVRTDTDLGPLLDWPRFQALFAGS